MERWIAETFHSDWRTTMRADKVLHEVQTEHQDLAIFENAFWGKVLILDGVFQLTTRDEFVYHEMMAHVPLSLLERPRKVLIVGGGDGGVLREVLKHPSVEQATLVEIDESVIETSIKYYPEIGKKALKDKRSRVIIADGRDFVATTDERFDVVISDSSEPIGPSAVLHTKSYFEDCKRILKDSGIAITQSGLPFHTPKHLRDTAKAFGSIFKDATAYSYTQPCYFGSEFTSMFGTDDPNLRQTPLATIVRRATRRGLKTRYWTPELQLATFMLPGYIKEVCDKATATKPAGKKSAGKK